MITLGGDITRVLDEDTIYPYTSWLVFNEENDCKIFQHLKTLQVKNIKDETVTFFNVVIMEILPSPVIALPDGKIVGLCKIIASDYRIEK